MIYNFAYALPLGETSTHSLDGSAEYFSPEHVISGESIASKANDVWACGIVLYYLLTDVIHNSC
jgi:serine/threonine protein kinase